MKITLREGFKKKIKIMGKKTKKIFQKMLDKTTFGISCTGKWQKK